MEIPDGFDDFVPVLWSGFQFVCGVVAGGVVGGFIGHRWKLLEKRVERKRAFKVFLERLVEAVRTGNPWKATDMHGVIATRLREESLNVAGDYGRIKREKLKAAWEDFAAIPYEALTPDGGGQTREERMLAMRRGLILMEAKLRAMVKLV